MEKYISRNTAMKIIYSIIFVFMGLFYLWALAGLALIDLVVNFNLVSEYNMLLTVFKISQIILFLIDFANKYKYKFLIQLFTFLITLSIGHMINNYYYFKSEDIPVSPFRDWPADILLLLLTFLTIWRWLVSRRKQ